MKKTLLLSLFIILLSACKAGKNNDQKKHSTLFVDREYQLVSIEGRDVTEMNLAMRINTEQKSISGGAGCNNYRFNYELDEDKLDMGFGVATKMYCEETMDVENAFFAAASKVKHFSQTENMIYFLDEENKVLLKAKIEEREGKK